MYAVDGLVTEDSAGRPSQSAWRDWCSDAHGQLEMTFTRDTYRGSVVRQATHDYAITAWTGDAERIRRTPRSIRTDPRGTYEIVVPVQRPVFIGSDDPDLRLEPGEIALVPTDRPFAVAHHDATTALSLKVPLERIDLRLGVAAGGGTCRTSTNALAAIASDLLLGAQRRRAELTATAFDAVCDRAIDLICLAMNGEIHPTSPDATSVVVGQVRRHIRAHATDPDVSLDDIARAVGWSPRYVQAALAKEGLSARSLIRSERLGLARLRLADPRFANRSIEWIAHTIGFTSASAFSKAYRREFGMTPRESRT